MNHVRANHHHTVVKIEEKRRGFDKMGGTRGAILIHWRQAV